jgi:hypothetical protein
VLANLFHGAGEELPVLGRDDGLDWRAQHADAKPLKVVLELDADAERRLPAKGNINAVRPLVLDDLGDKFGGNREEEDLVG